MRSLLGAFCVLAMASLAFLGIARTCAAGGWFAEDSPWNSKVPQNAVFLDLPELEALSVGWTSGKDDYANVAVYFATEDDPLRPVLYNFDTWLNVHQGKWKRAGNPRSIELSILEGATNTLPYEANFYSTTVGKIGDDSEAWVLPPDFHPISLPVEGLMAHIPPGIKPSPDSDGYMVVFQPDGRALETYSSIVISSGEVVAMMFGLTDPKGDGTGWQNGRRASMIPSYAGILMDKELWAGRIKHALAVIIGAEVLGQSYVWPAYAFDRNPYDYRGRIAMGTHLAIPPGVDLAKLPWNTASGRAIAQATQTYGLYVVDRGGPNGLTFVTELDVTHPEFGGWNEDLYDDLVLVLDALKRVLPSRR